MAYSSFVQLQMWTVKKNHLTSELLCVIMLVYKAILTFYNLFYESHFISFTLSLISQPSFTSQENTLIREVLN